jgi:hypothetical protein
MRWRGFNQFPSGKAGLDTHSEMLKQIQIRSNQELLAADERR